MWRIIEERLAELASISLKSGSHVPNHTFCVMEACSWVAGEPWSDHPECACPIIGAFLRSWNDSLPSDAERDRLLKPLIAKLVGTRNPAVEEKRSLMAADWLIRVHTPTWLRLAGLNKQADILAALPEITSMAQYPSLRGPIEAIRDDASAARAAARDAAWAAAGAAARDAAGAAAGAAAWAAAGAAAWDAAWAAARDAAWAAARDAARDALKPTVTQLQESALALVERMIAVQE
jgi:hypothetical protein